jgi:hypothetical protein
MQTLAVRRAPAAAARMKLIVSGDTLQCRRPVCV